MKQTLTTTFFGEQADFLLNANKPKIIQMRKLSRERSAVEITIEIDN